MAAQQTGAKIKAAWKDGVRIKANAQLVYTELLDVYERRGNVTPETLLEEAGSGTVPEISRALEWNDAEAARRYRVATLGHIVRSLVLTTVRVSVIEREPEQPRRVFLNVKEDGASLFKTRTDAIRDNPEYLYGRAIQDLREFVARYDDMPFLYAVVRGVAKLIERHGKPKVH